jgi:hypothetical protein
VQSLRRSLIARIWPIALIWLFVCGLLLLTLWPWRPSSFLQWALFFVFGPIGYVAIEYLGEVVLSPKIGARISARSFSCLRIAYALCALLLLVALAFAAYWLIAPAFGGQGS